MKSEIGFLLHDYFSQEMDDMSYELKEIYKQIIWRENKTTPNERTVGTSRENLHGE